RDGRIAPVQHGIRRAEILVRTDFLLGRHREQIVWRDDVEQNRSRAFNLERLIFLDSVPETIFSALRERGCRHGQEQERNDSAFHQRQLSWTGLMLSSSPFTTVILRSSESQLAAVYLTVCGPTGIFFATIPVPFCWLST